MRIVIVLCCVLAVVLAEKRNILGNLFDGQEIHKLVDAVVEKFGTDATEKQCESECTILFTNDILDLGCDFACRGIQSLIQKLHS